MLRRAIFVVAVGGLTLISGSGPVSAHADLRSSIPSDGEQVEAPPEAVVLSFNEPISPVPKDNLVLNRAGEQVDTGDISTVGAIMHIPLRAGLPNGSYVVRWGAVGPDGHPARGAFVFAIGEPVSLSPGDVTVPSRLDWPAWAASIARGLEYLAALLTVGFAAFHYMVSGADRRLRRIAFWLASITVGAVGVVLVAETLRLVEGDWGDLRGGATWHLAWDARHAPAALLAASGAALLALWSGARSKWPIAGLGAGVLGLGLAWSGHSAGVERQWAGVGVDAVHVLAVGAWFGGLSALCLMARVEGERVEGAVVQRFSRMATVAFPLAVLTGGLMLWQVLPALEDLVDTTYGRLLVAKMVVVATAGVAAYLNRMRVVRAFRAGKDRTPLLRRLLAVEIGALICVVGLTATLTGQPPGSARNSDETAGSAPYVSDQFVGPYHVVVSLTPRQVGTNSLTVDFHAISEEGQTPPVAATAEFVLGDAGADPSLYELENTAGSRFIAQTVEFPIEGEWKLRLRVQIGESEQEEATFTIRIPR